jgi:SIR2-like domain
MVTTDDPYLPLAFSLASSPGAYAVLAGAGVSKGAGLPSAWDIEVDLVRQIAERDKATVLIDDNNAEQWYADNYGKQLTYSTVIEEVTNTAHERQALLGKYFESVDEEDGTSTPSPPSAAHRAIARLVEAGIIRVIVTMNFDRLFELALVERDIEPTIVATGGDAKGLGPLHLVQACVIHLHGDYLNATSMLNTAAELTGYTPNMRRLLRHVLGDYGLIVAGWSAEHDTALREAVKASYTKRFTMGWISPGHITDAASQIIGAHSAAVFKTTADDAFAHLADQVTAIRQRQARHPLTEAVAASRIKRHLTQQSPAISAHDMVAEEFTRLRGLPEFDLSNYSNSDPNYAQELRSRVIEAARIPVAAVAVLAYWGDPETDRWWMSNLERLARPTRHSGSTWLINLPLVAASMLFYAAGVAAACAQNYERVARVFGLHGEPINRAGPVPAWTMLAPDPSMTGLTAAQHHKAVSATLVEVLGPGSDVIDDAWQLFEILRLAQQLTHADQFHQAVMEAGGLIGSQAGRAKFIAALAARCHPDGLHLLAVEQVYSTGTHRRWSSPVAERLAAEVDREGSLHPIVSALNTNAENIELALEAVSDAVGQVADRHPANRPGPGGWMPDRIWLDA